MPDEERPQATPETNAEQAKKKQSSTAAGCVCLVLLVVIFVVLFSHLSGLSSQQPTRTVAPKPITKHVIYSVSGTAREASLTYRNQSGGTEQITVRLPWDLEMDLPPGRFVYLSAQKTDEAGTIHAEIWGGSGILQEANSSTAFGIASVSGSVPR